MSTDLQFRTCLPGSAGFHLFTAVLAQVYGPDHPRLQREESIAPAHLLQCVVALQHERPVARFSLYDNKGITMEGKKVLLIGNFECMPSGDLARAVLQEAGSRARAYGKSVLVGPMNGSTWEDYRFSLSENTLPFLTEYVHAPGYASFFREGGFDVLHRYVTGISPIGLPAMDPKLEASVTAAGITVRPIDLSRFEAELERIYTLCAAAFSGNALYTPIDRESFVRKYRAVEALVDPRFVLLAERKNEVLALLFCLPDLLQPQEKRIVIKTIARHPNVEVKGLMSYLLLRFFPVAYEGGYRHLLHAYMHEENRSVLLSQFFGGSIYSEYALFFKQIDPA